MNERIYKTMSASGVVAVVVGIVIAAVGIGCGAVSIIFGGNLLKRRKQVVF